MEHHSSHHHEAKRHMLEIEEQEDNGALISAIAWVSNGPESFGPLCGAIRRWWNLQEVRTKGRCLGHGSVPSTGIVGHQLLPLPFFAS